MNYKILMSPMKIGKMELKNHLMVPAMGTNLANPDGTISDALIEYWSVRAKGGWGILTVEVTAIDPLGKAIPNEPCIYDDKFIDGWKRLADEVHKYGAKISVQLHHAGRQTSSYTIGDQPVAPSPIPCPSIQEIPRELTTEEVYALIENFGDGARRAQLAGIDAVEIHGAHGYLVAQFLSAYSNKRLDEFGGSFENRMRFGTEIIKNIRKKTGPDYPIIFRLSADELVHSGRKVDESRLVAKFMEEAGADCISVSMGVYASTHYIIPSYSFEHGTYVQYAEDIKKAVNVPVVTVGKITDPNMAEEILKTGKADIIAMGRQALADPEFPNKVANGLIDEIVPCLSCAQGCATTLFTPGIMKVTCLNNPFCGYETELIIKPATEKKKVVVIGAGPGGLYAAGLSAARGHKVVLFEKTNNIGGNFLVGAMPTTKQEIIKGLKAFKTICDKNEVEMRLNTEATAENIAAEEPDEIIIATGSIPIRPRIKGLEQSNIVFAGDVLEGKAAVGKKVLIVGGGSVGCETADFLGEYNKEITIVEMEADIAKESPGSVHYFLMKRLDEYKVEILTNTTVKEIDQDKVIVEHLETPRILEGFDTIIIAAGYESYNPFQAGLSGNIHVIGDAKQARQASEAIAEAARVALAI